MESNSSNYEYTTLMDILHVSVSKHLLDEHFTLVWANDVYYDLIGYPKPEYEALFHNQCNLYYTDDMDEWAKIREAVIGALKEGKGEYSLSSRMRRKNGESIWVRMSGSFTQEYINGYQVAYTVITDINDIMQTQLEQSVTYDNLPGFAAKYRIGSDLSFTLVGANQKFLDFFGETIQRNDDDPLFLENINRNADVLEAHREHFINGDPVHFTMRFKSRAGNNTWFQINGACVGWQNSEPIYLMIFIDITDETELRRMQKALEEQAEELKAALRMAEHANQAKTDFLSHMSHDIRTPMNAIIGMTDIAKSHLNDRERVQDCLKKISLSSQHLLGLINDVLDMSRIESGSMTISNESLTLPDVLENIVAIMQPQIKAKNLQFAIHLHNVRHESLISDALRLRQIFINILSNASKFTPAGGSITIEAEEEESESSDIALFHFTFTDTGIGMKPEFINQLFDPFTREKDSRVDKTEGSGLGMAITKKLVDLLGGTITVTSAIGHGTVFHITLPMKIDKQPSCDTQFPNLKIIVVDDDEAMRDYMKNTLESLGIQVECIDTGKEALIRVRDAHERGDDYDVAFLDWKMPDMDGLETARQIRREIGRQLPILIISAYDWSDIEEESRIIGVDGFIIKPLFVSTLCRTLKKYVLSEQSDYLVRKQTESQEFTGRRFLLVEDNELNREIAIELLTSAGADMEFACDGAEGLMKFGKSPLGYYDLILMDIQMPIMDGYEATKQIRRLPRKDAGSIPILAMTADAFAEDVAKAKKEGMNGHVAKPLNIPLLKQEIERVLKQE